MENVALKRAIVAALILILGAVEAFAQTAQLQTISVNLRRGGFTRTATESGGTSEGATRSHHLFSPSGVLVDSDRLPDHYPEVSASPRRSGWYRVDVEMAHCSSAPCFYEGAVHSR